MSPVYGENTSASASEWSAMAGEREAESEDESEHESASELLRWARSDDGDDDAVDDELHAPMAARKQGRVSDDADWAADAGSALVPRSCDRARIESAESSTSLERSCESSY